MSGNHSGKPSINPKGDETLSDMKPENLQNEKTGESAATPENAKPQSAEKPKSGFTAPPDQADVQKQAATTGSESKKQQPGTQKDPTTPPGASDNLESEAVDPMQELKAENAALKDKILRTMAEMENLRRRTEKEKTETAKYAISKFARDILSVSDNIMRAIMTVPEDAVEKDPALKSLLEGVNMTERELQNVFERHGIKRLDPKGDIFDPNLHQAMFEVPNPEVPSGTITEVVAVGYMIDERILRPAMVGVAKGGAKPQKQPETSTQPDSTAHSPVEPAPQDKQSEPTSSPEANQNNQTTQERQNVTKGGHIDQKV